MSTLQTIIDTLWGSRRPVALPYLVPGLWVDGKTPTKHAVAPYEFYAQRLEFIRDQPAAPIIQGDKTRTWSQRAIVYNMYPRITTAFPHADDGVLHVEPRRDGWRDTGTLLKAIALLPYIQSMGFNTVHLLPITAVGQDGKKGNLGSPYAIRNPYRLDENLAEPALDLSVDQLFQGFVEAAHHLGIRVVMEFVLRTASRDSELVAEHPDWFYWIRADIPDRTPGSVDPHAYGQPIFDPRTLQTLIGKVEAGDFHDLPPAPPEFRAMFTAPPRPQQVTMEHGRWFGTLDDGTRVRIPGAFADWPPEENQPPWSDVTYLRLYDHPDFNYIAYNTLRMYDTRLAVAENVNRPLWDAVIGVIPHYQRTFGIDGVLLDMGHALPQPLKRELVEAAHSIDPDFAFWEENFTVSEASRREGYDAVVGHMLFDLYRPQNMRGFIEHLAHHPPPIPFYAGAENHNTPRAAARNSDLTGNGDGLLYSYYTLPYCIAVPGIPFVHSGFELGETTPVNTGLDFNAAMLADFPAEKLPLFSAHAFDWTRTDNLVNGVRVAMDIRRRYDSLLTDPDPATWIIGTSDNPHIFVFTRRRGEQSLSFIFNTDLAHHQRGRALIAGHHHNAQGVWGTPDNLRVHHGLGMAVDLAPGYVLVLDSNQLPIEGC